MSQRVTGYSLLDPRRLCRTFYCFVINLAMEVMAAPDAAFGIDGMLFSRKYPKQIKRLSCFAELPRQGTGKVDARDTVPLVLLPQRPARSICSASSSQRRFGSTDIQPSRGG